MIGTVRTFSIDVRNDIVRRMHMTASNIAEATGATATVRFKDLSKPTRRTSTRFRRSSTTPR